jgi:hypothetical protein
MGGPRADAGRDQTASTVDYEYPLQPGVAPNPLLDPMASLHPPAIALVD